MMVIVDAMDATLKNLSMISLCWSAYVSFVSRLWGFDQLVFSTPTSFATEPPIILDSHSDGQTLRGR